MQESMTAALMDERMASARHRTGLLRNRKSTSCAVGRGPKDGRPRCGNGHGACQPASGRRVKDRGMTGEWTLSGIVLPYRRVKENCSGEAAGIKEVACLQQRANWWRISLLEILAISKLPSAHAGRSLSTRSRKTGDSALAPQPEAKQKALAG